MISKEDTKEIKALFREHFEHDYECGRLTSLKAHIEGLEDDIDVLKNDFEGYRTRLLKVTPSNYVSAPMGAFGLDPLDIEVRRMDWVSYVKSMDQATEIASTERRLAPAKRLHELLVKNNAVVIPMVLRSPEDGSTHHIIWIGTSFEFREMWKDMFTEPDRDDFDSDEDFREAYEEFSIEWRPVWNSGAWYGQDAWKTEMMGFLKEALEFASR